MENSILNINNYLEMSINYFKKNMRTIKKKI